MRGRIALIGCLRAFSYLLQLWAKEGDMVLLRLLAAFWSLALLLPAHAAAASAEQACPPIWEQPWEIGVFHFGLSPIAQVDVAIENLDRPLTLLICAPAEQ